MRAQIPERHLPAVRDGLLQGVLIASTILEGRTLPLKLKRLAGDAADARGGIDGLFEFTGGVPSAALGRPITITLTLPARENLLALPATALYGLNRLYLIDNDNRLQRTPATIVGEAMDSGQSLLLLKAPELHGGERVMITQLPQAIVGLSVEPQPAPGSNADTPSLAPEESDPAGEGQ